MMYRDPYLVANHSNSSILGQGLGHDTPITVKNDLVASLLLFPSTINSVASEQLLCSDNSSQRVSSLPFDSSRNGSGLVTRLPNTTSNRHTRIQHHPYQRQNVQKDNFVQPAKFVSSLRAMQQSAQILPSGLPRSNGTILVSPIGNGQRNHLMDQYSLLNGMDLTSGFQCLPVSTPDQHVSRNSLTSAGNNTLSSTPGPFVQLPQSEIITPVGLVGATTLVNIPQPANPIAIGQQISTPAVGLPTGASTNIPQLPLTSYDVNNQLPVSLPVGTAGYPSFSASTPLVPYLNTTPALQQLSTVITPNISPITSAFADSSDLLPPSLDGSLGLGSLDLTSLMLSMDANQPTFSFFPPLDTPVAPGSSMKQPQPQPPPSMTMNGGLPSPPNYAMDLRFPNLVDLNGTFRGFDGVVTAVPMSTVSPVTQDVSIDAPSIQSSGTEQILPAELEFKFPLVVESSTSPDKPSAVEESPELQRESSVGSESVVDDNESESSDDDSEYELPTRTVSSRKRQATGQRSGQRSAQDQRRSSIVSTVSQHSCQSSCDDDCETEHVRKSRKRTHGKPTSKRKQLAEEDDGPDRRHWTCEQCGKRFTRKFNLGQHMRIHSGRKPYVCEVENCGMAFVRDYDRKRHHISVHDVDKPFKCTHCELQFPRKDAYHRHLTKVGLM